MESIEWAMEPKLITSFEKLPEGEYLQEPKLSGYRLRAEVSLGAVSFTGRSGKTQDGKFAELEQELLSAFPPGSIIDGEITALKQKREKFTHDKELVKTVVLSTVKGAIEIQKCNPPMTYVAYDLLQLGEEDLREDPLASRKKTLNSILSVSSPFRITGLAAFPATEEDREALLEIGFEDTVLKRLDSLYIPGKKANGWYKIKA